MAAAFVQATNAFAAGFSTFIQSSAFASTPTSGNTLLVSVWWDNEGASGITSVSDSASNSYTLIGSSSFTSANAQSVRLARALNIAVSTTHTVKANFATGSAQAFRIVVHEVSGISTLAQNTYSESTTATPTAATITSSTDGQYYFAAIMDDSGSTIAYTPGIGFTEPAGATASPAAGEAMVEFQVQSAAGGLAASWIRPVSGHNVWGVATFVATTSGSDTFFAVGQPMSGMGRTIRVIGY